MRRTTQTTAAAPGAGGLKDGPGPRAPRDRTLSDRGAVKAANRDIREIQVSEWWRSGAIRTVVTTEGRPLRVLYPGRHAPHAGPDFRDTLLITEEGDLIRGDTEVHLKRGDWDGHGHRGDPRYERVALHLFLRGGGRPPEAGSQVQEVLLDQRAEGLARSGKGQRHTGPQQGAAPLERLRRLNASELERALEEAGERRFLGMACAYTKRLRAGDAQEELYAGVMEALGYSQNSAQMELLARGLPLRRLFETAGKGCDAPTLEAVLLGAAGLLHRQLSLGIDDDAGDESRSREMERAWRSAGAPVAVSRGAWSYAGMRPHNRPARRLAGAAVLIWRHRDTGLLEGFENALRSERVSDLERALVVEDGQEGQLTDTRSLKSRTPALIGRARARDVAVNVMLPFFYARAHMLGDAALGRLCLERYRGFPPGQENEITREMKTLLGMAAGKGPAVDSARRQQGLIHLYRVLSGQAA